MKEYLVFKSQVLSEPRNKQEDIDGGGRGWVTPEFAQEVLKGEPIEILPGEVEVLTEDQIKFRRRIDEWILALQECRYPRAIAAFEANGSDCALGLGNKIAGLPTFFSEEHDQWQLNQEYYGISANDQAAIYIRNDRLDLSQKEAWDNVIDKLKEIKEAI